MKICETCVCGAKFEVDADDDSLVCRQVRLWRHKHRCLGFDPWAHSPRSTVGGSFSFGFQQYLDRPAEVTT